MFRADFLPFTSKIVEHSRYLPMRAQQCQQSIHYSQQAYDAILQLRRERASTELPSADQAFIGRTFVNIGSACGGQADSLATYARVLAYWRCGKDLLEQAGAQDVLVPRDNIEGLRRVCTEQVGAGAYAQVWRASEPLYQRLLADLAPQQEGWEPLLTSMMPQTMPTPTQTGTHPTATTSLRKKRSSICRKGEDVDEDKR